MIKGSRPRKQRVFNCSLVFAVTVVDLCQKFVDNNRDHIILLKLKPEES